MGSFCARCGREAELYASTDGSMLCMSCVEAVKPHCVDCVKCHQRKCGDAVYACPFCHLSTPEDAREFTDRVKRLEPLRIDERCERCGGSMSGRAFIIHGKALCRNCLVYEQDRWEIVPGKPGKSGTRIKIVIEKPKRAGEGDEPPESGSWDEFGKKLFHTIGVDPENPPPDPFAGAKTLSETRMKDDSCVNCEAYAAGKTHAKFLGRTSAGDGKKAAPSSAKKR